MKTKTKRIKLKAAAGEIQTREEMEALVGEITELTLARNKQQTELDEAISKIRAGYEAGLAEVNQALAEKTEAARAWADEHPEEFRGLKSLEMTRGVVGWRTGQPQLKTISGWTWERVLTAVESCLGTKWLRVKKEVDKAQILSDRKVIGDEMLRKVGVRVVQQEVFFVDPKIESPGNRQQIAEAA